MALLLIWNLTTQPSILYFFNLVIFLSKGIETISTMAWTSSHSLLPSQGLQKHPQKHCMVKMHVPGHRVLLGNSSATVESISEIDSTIDFKKKLRKRRMLSN